MRVPGWLQLATTRGRAMATSAPLHVRLEGHKLLSPQRFGLLEPGPQSRDRLRPQRVDAHTCIELRMGFFDQAAKPQDPKMAAHGRRWQPQGVSQVLIVTPPASATSSRDMSRTV